jgi:hypothetical protein
VKLDPARIKLRTRCRANDFVWDPGSPAVPATGHRCDAHNTTEYTVVWPLMTNSTASIRRAQCRPACRHRRGRVESRASISAAARPICRLVWRHTARYTHSYGTALQRSRRQSICSPSGDRATSKHDLLSGIGPPRRGITTDACRCSSGVTGRYIPQVIVLSTHTH